LGKSVAVIERDRMLGGVCVNTGTIPSKSRREEVVDLTGMNQRELYGASYRVKEKIACPDPHTRTEHVINRENDVVRNQLMRNRVELYTGYGRVIDEHTVLSRTGAMPSTARLHTAERTGLHPRIGSWPPRASHSAEC
jgi:NAD(P) transhydrogenase